MYSDAFEKSFASSFSIVTESLYQAKKILDWDKIKMPNKIFSVIRQRLI